MVFDLGFTMQRRRLFDLLARDLVVERFDIRGDLRCNKATLAAEGLTSTVSLADRLALYEHCQERNRTAERTLIGLSSAADPVMALDLIDLHRSHVVMEESPGTLLLQHLKRFPEIAGQLEILDSRHFWQTEFDILVLGANRVSGSRDEPKERFHVPSAVWVPNAELPVMGSGRFTPSELNPHLFLRCTP